MLCSNKFDFLPLFCLVGLVPNSVLSGSRGPSVEEFAKAYYVYVQARPLALYYCACPHQPASRSCTSQAPEASAAQDQDGLPPAL